MSSIEGIQKRLENLFAGVAEAIPVSGPSGRAASPREISRPRGWVWELDPKGVYTWCSPEVERILGYTSDEMLGKPFYSAGFVPEAADLLRSHLESGDPIQHLLVDAVHRDGQSFKMLIRAMHRVDATGVVLGYRGVSQLVDHDTPEVERMVVEMPTPAAEIGATTPVKIAAGWGAILGYEDSDGDVQPIQEPIEPRAILSEDTGGRLVIPLQVQDEIIGVIELEGREDGSLWQDDDRALANAIAHELAITLQDARSYQLTQQALEEMREADRLKSQFLANMSHELRTPLNSIIGFSRVILKGIDGPITETQEQDLNAIYNAGQHLLGLINNILDISKIEAGKMELAFTDVDLSEIIRGVMATAVGLVKDKPIELITDIPVELPLVQADNIRIRQVLLNLVSNAAKFTETGHIGVSARTIQRGDRNEVVIAVFDTGPGIDQDDQERIFEPFSQVDASPTRKTGGTGLGLSISKHLVELHGGVIWVESIPDEGSTFAFTLPFDPDLQTVRSVTSLILGIDHDPASLLQYRASLETAGYRFHALSRPDQSLEVAKALQPQAILLDLFLGDYQPWKIIKTIADDPVFQSIPTLLTEFDESSDVGMMLPVQYWLPASSGTLDISTFIERFVIDKSGKLSLTLVDSENSDWSDVLQSIDTQAALEVQHLHTPDAVDAAKPDFRSHLLLISFSAPAELILRAFALASDLAGLITVGLIPDNVEMGSFKSVAERWSTIAVKPRAEFMEQVVEVLNTRVPTEPGNRT